MRNTQSSYKKLIQSQKWVKLRNEKIAKNPLCENCLLSDITTPATEVHHVVPVDSVPDQTGMERLCFDYYNLQSLCFECHKLAHMTLKSYTKEESQRRKKAVAESFADKFLKGRK